MTNLASTARNNVYYLRTVDPDNDEAEVGSSGYSTRNVIEHQLPNTDNLSTVSASSVTHPNAYVALTTNDLRAKAFIIPLYLFPTHPLDQLYDETSGYSYTPDVADTSDEGIGLVFNIGHLSSVDSVGAIDSAFRTTAAAAAPNRAIINYRYAFSSAAGPTSVKNITGTTIKVYPNPAKDQLNITNLFTSDHVQLFDMMGREMQVNLAVGHDGNNTFSISTLPAGQYLLQISDKDGNVRSKTPVQKL